MGAARREPEPRSSASGSSSATATRSPPSRATRRTATAAATSARSACAAPWRGQGYAKALLLHAFREFYDRGLPRVTLGVDAENPTGATHLYERVGMHVEHENVVYEKDARVSALRAKCPTCRTLTAVAIGDEYECHCVRPDVRGRARARAARVGRRRRADDRVGVRFRSTIPRRPWSRRTRCSEQTLALASDLPARPLVLGGCCCSHIGAVEGLAARHERLGVIWFDAHGDLNTPETSPSGNEWGMPLRMIIDGGAVAAADVARRRARGTSTRPRSSTSPRSGIHDDPDAVLDRVDCVYVALDCDVFEPSELAVFMPEPGGPTLAEVERALGGSAPRGAVVGAGLTGLAPDPANVAEARAAHRGPRALSAQPPAARAGLS